jgi:bifunctional DNA-binding transcriptional regulator/antitoxin component of YhaV-PrlF toxin-antitoxin module
MTETRVILGSGGRLVVPARFRKAMGVQPGDSLVMALQGSELRVLSPREALRRAQALVRRHVPAGRRLSEELIAERRREARRG